VLVQRTLKGAAFLRDMRGIMQQAEQTAREAPPPPAEVVNDPAASAPRRVG
jgi:hypothetical protein